MPPSFLALASIRSGTLLEMVNYQRRRLVDAGDFYKEDLESFIRSQYKTYVQEPKAAQEDEATGHFRNT
jgi:hypothetical protein